MLGANKDKKTAQAFSNLFSLSLSTWWEIAYNV